MTLIRIDASKKGGTISPLLFGHNLEHTRSCVHRGLAAQMLRNRKFAGKPDRSGQAIEWYPIGPDSTWFLLDWVPGNAYTAHFDPNDRRRDKEINSQVIESATSGAPAGIGQHGISLEASRRYEARVILKTDWRLSVRVRFAGHDPKKTLFAKTATVAPGAWRRVEFAFSPRISEPHARMEITIDRPGSVRIGAVSLLPADHFHGMRRDVVDLLKQMAPGILRWPGGNFAGDYRWQDGLLDADRRSPLAAFTEIETLPHSHGMDHHEIDTDAFIALCREVGAEPFITVNLAWDTPERAAAWVEYCNGLASSRWGRLRARRGHAKPYGVKYWSLGNELGYTHMEGPNSPSAYAKKAAAVGRAMKRRDSSIVLCSSGKWDIGSWYPEALRPLSKVVDLFSHHYYTWTAGLTFAGAKGRREFRRIVNTPRGFILDDLKRIRAKADRFASRKIGISFDEWNTWYAWYRKPGVMDGVHAAAMLNMLCREAAALGVPMCCYFEPVNEGAILVTPGGSRLTPVGQAFALFKAHQGRATLNVDAPKGDLDVSASLDEKTGEVVVTLVNLSPDRDAKVALDVPGARRAGAVVLRSDDFLPASQWAERRAALAIEDGRAAMTVPRHGVARVSLATGRRSR